MAITVYDDVILPNSILAAGVQGKQLRRNDRVMNQGGFDQINVIWTRTLRQFTLGTIPMTRDAWAAIEGLFEITDGGAFGFLMEDPKDSTVASGQGVMMPIQNSAFAGIDGFGYGVPTYQLAKRYTTTGSSRVKDRPITRPVAMPAMLRAGSPIVLGAGAGQGAIDLTTGILTMVADTSEAMTSITIGASTVLNFASGAGIVAALNVNDRVYLTGVTGTAATTLNTHSHLITAKGASSLTVSTVTTGLTATGGTAFKYPQPSETMAWTGRFYVPVHFMSDEIDWDIITGGPAASRMLSGPSVVLEEVRE